MYAVRQSLGATIIYKQRRAIVVAIVYMFWPARSMNELVSIMSLYFHPMPTFVNSVRDFEFNIFLR